MYSTGGHQLWTICCAKCFAKEVEARVLFCVGKVIEEGKNQYRMKIGVSWYWPTMQGRAVDEPNSIIQHYANCMDSMWEPSGEPHRWVEKVACIFSWLDEPEDPGTRLLVEIAECVCSAG